MKEIVYREARLDEYQKIGKVLAGAFMDYPFMTLIKDDLKKPEYYQAFLELLDSLLTKLYIKGETCLVAERDGEIMAVALLQQKDFFHSILFAEWYGQAFPFYYSAQSLEIS